MTKSFWKLFSAFVLVTTVTFYLRALSTKGEQNFDERRNL